MSDKLKFRAGFEHEAVSAGILDRNPGWVPVVRLDGVFAFGEVVALAETRQMAEEFAAWLNCREAGDHQ